MSLLAVIAISMALSHFGHMPNGGVQSSMVFPDERSFYTARNVNPDFITEREEDLSERILTLANPHESTRDDLRNS